MQVLRSNAAHMWGPEKARAHWFGYQQKLFSNLTSCNSSIDKLLRVYVPSRECLGKQPIVGPRGMLRVIHLRSLVGYCTGRARPPANSLDGKEIVVAWEYNNDPCWH